MQYPISPSELAEELGHTPGVHPGHRVRKFLRNRYPDHPNNQPWKLDKTMADAVRAHFEVRNHFDRRAGRRPRLLDR
ncbi:hypothetical protein ACFWHR_14300 [Leucobacter sp. NPDC058333]|uniref:hypothetical protein n=1 Tax=Leucobacter sp. NPDC058333 TaxID=3346450 RepID=UPI0036675B15